MYTVSLETISNTHTYVYTPDVKRTMAVNDHALSVRTGAYRMIVHRRWITRRLGLTLYTRRTRIIRWPPYGKRAR